MAIANTAQLTIVTRLYTALFNRAPDTAGLSFWGNALANGANINTVTQGFLNAPEGVSQYPAFQSANAFVTSFYTKVFGRSPDAAGLAFWVAALNNLGGAESAVAKASLASKIIDVVSTPLSAADAALPANAQSVADRAIFANKVELGTYLATNSAVTTQTAKSFDPAGTNPVAITADPSSIDTLKAGVFSTQIGLAAGPNVLGTDSGDLFISTIAQLNGTTNATRVYDGAAGSDTLNLDLTVTPNATIRDGSVINIETVKLLGTTAGTSIDASKAFLGSTTIIVDAANGATINGLAGKALGFTGGTAGNAAVTANFGSAATTANITLTSLPASAGVTASPAIAAALLLGSSANVTTSALASATVSGSGTLTINNTFDSAANAAANLATGSSLKTVNVASTGTINLDTTITNSSVTAIDASTSTGAVKASISSLQSYKGGAGIDTVVIAAAPTKLLDGGAGDNDVIVLNGASDLLVASAGNIANFETISVGVDSTATTISVAPFKHVQIDQAQKNGVAFTGAAAGTDLVIKAAVTGASSFALADSSGTADALTITLSSGTGLNNTGVLTVAGIESLKVVSTDTATATVDGASKLALTAAAATSLTVTGNTGIDFSNTTAAKITTFDATGLVIGTATADAAKFVSSNSTVGASVSIKGALNGVNTLSGNAANDTIVGGAGADTLSSGTGLDFLTGGAGADTFIVSANANKSIFATITDFAKGDVLNVGGDLAANHTFTAGTITKVALAAGTFDQLLAAAVANAATSASNSVASWFQSGTDTYVVIDNTPTATNAAFVDGTDQIVKLTGLVDLTTATINAAGTSLTIA